MVKHVLWKLHLRTVCESAKCPNICGCWNAGALSFLILGDVCTRTCTFCAALKHDEGRQVEPDEPERIARAVEELGLRYVSITSVTRDDLADGGASQFAECINKIKRLMGKEIIVDVLIPDFAGSVEALQKVIEAHPDMIGHNVETVPRLQQTMRDSRARFETSIGIIKKVALSGIPARSSLMVGLGESDDEVRETLRRLKEAGVTAVSLGQYLCPGKCYQSVVEFVRPEKFMNYELYGKLVGIPLVKASPFSRGTSLARLYFERNIDEKIGINEKVSRMPDIGSKSEEWSAEGVQ